MKTSLFLTLSILSFVMLSCSGDKKKEMIKATKTKAIEIHDEVMPKIGELRTVRIALTKVADSIQALDTAKSELIYRAATDLSNASEGMMQWMRNFEPEFEGTDEEILQYFEEQKTSIEKVKSDMLGSLAKGKEVLSQYQ